MSLRLAKQPARRCSIRSDFAMINSAILFVAIDDCLVKEIIKLFLINRNLKVPHGTMT
jgi:hypothetical protein